MFDLFSTLSPLTPHGFCLAWDPMLLAITIIGNLLTAISYILIPLEIAWFVWAEGASKINIVKSNALYLFVLFILLCGVSHQLDIVTLWLPYYWFQGVWIMATGIVSVITALSIPYLIDRDKGP